MLKYWTMGEGTIILSQCSTNGCLVWLLKFFSPRSWFIFHFCIRLKEEI